jgi:hypothetical protein
MQIYRYRPAYFINCAVARRVALSWVRLVTESQVMSRKRFQLFNSGVFCCRARWRRVPYKPPQVPDLGGGITVNEASGR